MNAEELKDTWEAYWRDKQESKKNKLASHYFKFVERIAGSLSNKLNHRVQPDELASHGVSGLYRAIERFEVGRGNKFETYAYTRIWGSMLDGLREEDWVPRSVRIKHAKMEKVRQKLEAKNTAKVNNSDILEDMEIDESEFYSNIHKFIVSSISSIESCVSSDIDDDDNKKDFNTSLVAKNNPAPDSNLLRTEFISKLIGKSFTKLDRKIIYLYYYEELTMREIAAKLNISESKVSQLHQTMLDRLKKKIKTNPEYFGEDIFSTINKCNDTSSLF